MSTLTPAQFAALFPWFGRGSLETLCADGFPIHTADPYKAQHHQLDRVIAALSQQNRYFFEEDIRHQSKPLLSAAPEERVLLVKALLIRNLFCATMYPGYHCMAAGCEGGRERPEPTPWPQYFAGWQSGDALLRTLLESGLPFTETDLVQLLQWAPHYLDLTYRSSFPYERLLACIRLFKERNGLGCSLEEALTGFRDALKLPDVLEQQLDPLLDITMFTGISRSDAWGERVVGFLTERSETETHAWRALLACAYQHGKGAKPTQKYLKEARANINKIGVEPYRQVLTGWLVAVSEAKPTFPLLNERNTSILRSLVWTAPLVADGTLCLALEKLAAACTTKIPGVGVTSVKLSNACLLTLSRVAGLDGVTRLVSLQNRIKYPSARKYIAQLLDEAARGLGISREDIEDLSVPDYGLTDGVRTEKLGNHTALLKITGTGTPELGWYKADGRQQKTVPKEVATQFAGALKALKGRANELKKGYAVQRDRLESFYLRERVIPFGNWQKHYLHHDFLGNLVRRLIWSFEEADKSVVAMWQEGQLLNAQGETQAWMGAQTKVRLWHPVEATPAEVEAWRDVLEAHQVRQPFKQAYREVYLVTDAELRTEVYSNRFAAHVIGQHQFSQLAFLRGWQYRLRGSFDGHNQPFKILPTGNLRTEYWLDDVAEQEYGGIWRYMATDQVRFYRHRELVPVRDVPPLVFSEVMRDVDLFVGVASIGNDPNWQDRGDQAFNGYWHDYSFGDLSATAQTRKAVLERLLPKLRIAGQCSLEGRFLKVHGKLRTYKIHLGSGNILMEPNDQYLCIVPDRRANSASENVFLPFDGDKVLSIILSKAFLLAADEQITDPTITRQLQK